MPHFFQKIFCIFGIFMMFVDFCQHFLFVSRKSFCFPKQAPPSRNVVSKKPSCTRKNGTRGFGPCLASKRKKLKVSPDPRPPTSPARTTSRALERRPISSCCCQGHSTKLGRTMSSCPRPRAPGSPTWCQWPVASKQGKPISHDFKSSAVNGLLWNDQIQITDHDIRSDPRARLATNLRSCQLHCEPTS